MISVCVATFNGEKYIQEQIQSVLPQLSEQDEIIISDDHSSDCTIKVIDDIGDSRIKVFMNQYEKGYVSNFQNALRHAAGEYIFLCDQDDIWLDNKVRHCMDLLQHYDFVVSDAIIINKDKEIISQSFYTERRIFSSLIGNILKFSFLGCCMAFKKDILQKALPFPVQHKYCTHDNWLFLVAKMFYKVKITPEKLILYRRHTSNASNGGFNSQTSLSFKITYRFYLIFHLLKLVFIK